MLAIGDSKTDGDPWVDYLITSLGAGWSEFTPRMGYAGYGVASVSAAVIAALAPQAAPPVAVLINVGANDIGTLPAEATWKTYLRSMLNHLIVTCANARLYIATPWRRGYAADCDTLATWIADVIGGYGSNVLAGMDERVWLEGGDDGATMTTDGIHYSVAGEVAAAAAWAAVISA